MEFEVTETDKGVWVTIKGGESERKSLAVRYETVPGGGRAKIVTEAGARIIEELASEGANIDEMADALGICRNTFYTANNKERTKTAYAKGIARCKTRLRSKQVEVAMRGDKIMLMFLGKVMLGQRETEQTASSELTEFVKAMQSERRDTEEE